MVLTIVSLYVILYSTYQYMIPIRKELLLWCLYARINNNHIYNVIISDVSRNVCLMMNRSISEPFSFYNTQFGSNWTSICFLKISEFIKIQKKIYQNLCFSESRFIRCMAPILIWYCTFNCLNDVFLWKEKITRRPR